MIHQGRSDGLLSVSETNELNSLKTCRNPYVHTKDSGNKELTFLDQLTKIAAPEIAGVGVEDEARKAVSLLITLFPMLCMRM